jgi:hypothetical protein
MGKIVKTSIDSNLKLWDAGFLLSIILKRSK